MNLIPTSSSSVERLLSVYMALGQYPILSTRIRARMRRELFDRQIIDPKAFDAEVRQKAVRSQEREGLINPNIEETSEVWEQRSNIIREQLTDWYFSQNLPFSVFEKIVRDVLNERGAPIYDLSLSINPELAPIDLLFDQARAIEKMPQQERANLEARLRENKVVMIRSMISDQLGYINIAKDWFTVEDLEDIRRRKIGPGKIGGKSAGMLLAAAILNKNTDETLRSRVCFPESYYLGADVMYTFMSINNLVHWNAQKYKTEDQMHAEYPLIQRDFEAGQFPPDVLEKLHDLLVSVGSRPVIVRSSSLLEDNFGTAFAGKYESIFLPNQGTLQENLFNLTRAIARVYSTTLNPSALLYRRSKGLQDYDERMAILLQVVEGEKFGRYYFPTAAGVAFSRNLYRWSPQIRREDGFVRLVWGMGTRAVDRVGNDYPRLVALSHPMLRPSAVPKLIRRYSQQYIDLIDLETNEFVSKPIHEILSSRYLPLRYVAQLEEDGYFSSLRSSLVDGETQRLVVTFDEFLRRTPFAETMRVILKTLESAYHSPVDMEFTVQVEESRQVRPEVHIAVIQCRPQSHLRESSQVRLPVNLPEEGIIFSTGFMVPQGAVQHIRYVVFVEPEGYFSLPTSDARTHLGRVISALNTAMDGECFICVGPGRWGTSNPDLGVYINYADIYNSRSLIELTGQGIGPAPDPSLGTHFFQDLLEGQIFPLAINLDDSDAIFNRNFFYQMPNQLSRFLPDEDSESGCLRLIDVEDYRKGYRIDLIMDDEQGRAVAFLVKPDEDHSPSRTEPQRIEGIPGLIAPNGFEPE